MEEKNTSRLLEMSKLNNTRDLGGIRTAEGKVIRDGRLFRSGQLYFADTEDIKALKQLGIAKIFDFRSSAERTEKPDPDIGADINIHLPIVRDIYAGIAHDKKSEKMAFDMVIANVAKDPDFGIRYMEDTYIKMVADDYAVQQYGSFIRAIADSEGAPVLWHCTAGKDRAGFATVLMLELMGVSREDIIKDYMDTNIYLENEIGMILDMLKAKMDIEGAEEAIRDFFGAREEYITMLYEYTDKNWGGMDRFIRDAMEIDDETKDKLRRMYLI